MGFSNGAFAKVWEVKQVSDTMTSLRISISAKDRQTGQYVQRFGGYVSCLGTACASKARGLKQGDRIKLERVDVENQYDRDSGKTYTNFNVWAFELQESDRPAPPVDSGTPPHEDEPEGDGRLPF